MLIAHKRNCPRSDTITRNRGPMQVLAKKGAQQLLSEEPTLYDGSQRIERNKSMMADSADDDSRLFGGIILSAQLEARAGDDSIDFNSGWLSKATNVDKLSNEDGDFSDGAADASANRVSEATDLFAPIEVRAGDDGIDLNLSSGWLPKATNVDTLSDEGGDSPDGAADASAAHVSEATNLFASMEARAGDDVIDFNSGWLPKATNVDTLSNEDGDFSDGAADASAARLSEATDLFAPIEARAGDDGIDFSSGWLSKATNVDTLSNEDGDLADGAVDASANRVSEATDLFALMQARAGNDGIDFSCGWLSKAANVITPLNEDDDSPDGAADASAAHASEAADFSDLDFVAESFIKGDPESHHLKSGINTFEENQGAADGGEAHLIGSLFQTLNFEDAFDDASERGEMATIERKSALTSQELMHPQLWGNEEEHLELKEDVIGMAFDDQQPKLRATVKEFVPASERTNIEQYPAIECNRRNQNKKQLRMTGQSVVEEGQTIAGDLRKYVNAAEVPAGRGGDVSLATEVIALAIKDNGRKQKIPRELQKSVVEREFRRVGMPMKDEAKKLGLSLKELFQQREEVARNIGLTYSQLAEMLGRRKIKLALRDESILAGIVDANDEQREREELTNHWNKVANRIIFYVKKLEYNPKRRQPSKSERKERVEEQFRKLGLPSKCEANAMGISSKVVIKHRAEVARRIGMPYDVLCQRLGDRKLELILDDNILVHESDQSDVCTANMDAYHWKQHIPEAAVGSISPALLDELKFPPFRCQGAALDTGIYEGADGSGLLIIDNNNSPGLRGTLHLSHHDAESNRDAVQAQSCHFPSLPRADGAETFPSLPDVVPTNQAAKQAWGKGPSKSLSQISKSVRVHDPVLAEKQRKANALAAKKLRELEGVKAKRYSRPAKLGLDSSAKQATPTEAFKSAAKALAKTGWARLVSGTAELNPGEYSDSLLSRAKLHMPELIKLERQLVRFLVDDEAPSLSLKPMKSRSIRKFFNDYCKCWKLQTKSYDASPRITQKGVYKDPDRKLYVQCNKLDNTCAPFPLLSDAARDLEHQSAKKKKKKKVFDPCASIAEGRVPLKLLPRTVPDVDALCQNPKETQITKAILMAAGSEVQSSSTDTDSA